jgi:hypothetical protein
MTPMKYTCQNLQAVLGTSLTNELTIGFSIFFRTLKSRNPISESEHPSRD